MIISTYMEAVQPEGGSKAWEQIDHSTLQLIANLFPAPTLGQVFVTRFVERAAAERSIAPGLKAGDVVICTKSIATLSEELNLAYDTAQKYVALFRALGLLQKQTFMSGQIAFILSLGIYLPPRNLEANLDYLLQRSKAKKSRTKYHDLVADVKERCLVYGLIDQEFTDALRQLHALVQPPAGLSRSKLEQRLAQAQHLVSTMIARAMTERLPREDALLTQNLPRSPGMTDDDARRRESEVPPSNLPGAVTSRDAELQKQRSESTQPGESGRFAERRAGENLSGQAAQVDSRRLDHSSESIRTGRLGRRVNGHVVQNLPRSPGLVDSRQRDHDSESTQTARPGRRGAPSDAENPPTGSASIDSQGITNVNVGNIITSNLNVNVKIVAAFLCRLFNEPTSKQGIYSRLFRDGCNQAEAIHAAAIFTLVHFHRDKTIENPAAVFIARCKAYHKTGIPDEAAELLAEYGALTYQQLLDVLRKRAPSSASSRHGISPLASAAHPATPSSLPPLPQWGTIQRLIPVESSRHGMSRQEALQVVACARGDLRTKMCRVDLERLSDSSYAVLLDNTITAIPRQTYFYSLREWEARAAPIKDCFELFGVIPARRRCLADALKERSKR